MSTGKNLILSIVLIAFSSENLCAALFGKSQAKPGAQPTANTTAKDTVKVPINNIGIASTEFTNPRKPFKLTDNGGNLLGGLEFVNRTADRKFLVTMQVEFDPNDYFTDTNGKRWKLGDLPDHAKDPGYLAAIRSVFGVDELSGCELREAIVAADRRVVCTAALTVVRKAMSGSARFTADLLSLDKSKLLEFNIRRFGENDSLSNSTGYAAKDPADVKEKPSKTTVKPVASVGLNSDPVFGLFDPDGEDGEKPPKFVIDDTHILTGDRRTHVPGSARLDVRHNIGSRADADLSFRFNNEDFGDQDGTSDVTARKYKLSIFAQNGTTLNFGKYVFATPGSEIAISESGQGFTLSRGIGGIDLRASYVAKSEGNLLKQKKDTRDNTDYMFEVNNIDLHRLDASVNLIAVYGENDDPSDAHVSQAYGGELFFSAPLSWVKRDSAPPVFGGTLAAFRTNRSQSRLQTGQTEPASPRGRGTTLLARGTVSLGISDAPTADEATVKYTIGASVAMGSGDRASTTRKESYIGENQAFAPDLIFFSTLLDPLTAPAVTEFESGIANKRYYSVDFTTNRWSLLEPLARTIGVEKTDIASRATTVQVNQYRFRNASAGKLIGTEYDVRFEIETPRAVTVTLDVGYFVPASRFETLIRENVWSIAAGVKIEP
jgi:hypothetical protein